MFAGFLIILNTKLVSIDANHPVSVGEHTTIADSLSEWTTYDWKYSEPSLQLYNFMVVLVIEFALLFDPYHTRVYNDMWTISTKIAY